MTDKTKTPDPLSVRFTAAERRMLSKAAKASNKKVSVLVREAAMTVVSMVLVQHGAPRINSNAE